MDRIDGHLKDLLKKLDLEEPMQGWKAVELWAEVVGRHAAGHARAIAMREGTLIVEVDSAAWMNELGYQKRRAIRELNERMDGNYVKDIRFQPAAGEESRTGE
jgi:predicted nucleic acid-binding Zn ribbon protein